MSTTIHNTHLRGSQPNPNYSRSPTHSAGLPPHSPTHNRVELASEELPLTMLNIPHHEPLQSDGCPVGFSTERPGKQTSNKLKKSQRGRPQNPTTTTSPSPHNRHPKTPTMGKPMTDSLKARIRNGPVGKSLGKLAVEHDLVSIYQPPAGALLGIPEDEMHSRNSYICIVNDALEYARTHLEKGERAVYFDSAAVRSNTAPGRIGVPVMQVDGNAHMHLRDPSEDEQLKAKPTKSAPPQLDGWKVREQQQHTRQAYSERANTNAGRSGSPARHPSGLRPGKKHVLCNKFEQPAASSQSTAGKSDDRDELYLHLPKPQPQPHTYHGSSSQGVTARAAAQSRYTTSSASVPRNHPNYSKPLPVIPELRPSNPRPQHCPELEATQLKPPPRYPIPLRIGGACQPARRPSVISLGKSRATTSLSHKPGYSNLASASQTSLVGSTSKIKMLPGRRLSNLGTEPASPRIEARRRSKQHRGTVIVTCDSDKEDGASSHFPLEALEQLKHIGESANGSGSEAESEALVSRSATVVVSAKPKMVDIKGLAHEPRPQPEQKPVERKPLTASASSMCFSAGQILVTHHTQPQPQPSQASSQVIHGHSHPLRSNSIHGTHPQPSQPRLRPGHPPSKPVTNNSISTSIYSETNGPNRSLNSVRRTTRDPANRGTAFGVQQFQDHDPAASYNGSDEYREIRRTERRREREAKRKFEEGVTEKYRERAQEYHSKQYVEELKERGKW